MTETDLRRKLSFNDYQKIAQQFDDGLTIRSIASEFHVSTKYVNRIIHKSLLEIASGAVVWDSPVDGWNPHRCSGCFRPFETMSALQSHFDFYLSGGQTSLVCTQMAAGFTR